MADKQIEIEVVTKTNLDGLDDLSDKVDEIKGKADELEFSPDVDVTDVEALQSAFEEATSEVERLSDELAGIEMGEIDGDFDAVTAQLEEASSRVDELQSALDSLDGSNAGAAADEVGNIGSNASDASGEVDNLGNSLGLLDASALMSISSELGNLGSQAEGMAQDMNTAAISVGQLATQTGIAEPQMVSLINNISNATFPQNEAMAYVEVLGQMGVSADKLGDSATNMDRINDATGMGYSKVMLLTQGLQAMGITADNLPASFNAIAYAESNVGGGAETLQQVLKRQAGTLNEYGMDVDSTVVALSALQRETGLTGMKLGNEFGNRLKDCNGDLSQLEQSLGLQAGALSNASQVTGEYSGVLQDLANEEAEHKTWLDQLGAAWEDLTLSMSPVLSPLMSFMGIIGQAGSWAVGVNGLIQLGQHFRNLNMVQGISGKLNTLKTALIGVGNSAKTALLNIASFARTLATTVYQAAVNAAKALYDLAVKVLMTGYNALKSAAMWVAEKAAVVASTLAEYALTAAQWLLNVAMSANPIGIVVVALAALAAALVWAYYNVDWFREMVDGAWQALQEFASFVWGGLTGALNDLGNTFNNVGQIMQDTIGNATTFIMETLQGVWDYITTLGGLLPADVDITGNQIIDTVLRVMAFMFTLPAQIGMIFINIIASALGFGDNFTQNMISSATSSVNGFVGQISALPGRAMAYLNNLLSRAVSFASGFAQRVINGATSAVNGFIQWIQSLPGKLQEEFDKMLDMASNFAMQIADKLSFGGASMVAGWITGSGEHSPGYMYEALIGELEAMANAPLQFLTNLPQTIQDLGAQMAIALLESIQGTPLEEPVMQIIGLFQQISLAEQNLWNTASMVGNMLFETVSNTGSMIMNSIMQVISYISTLPGQIAAQLSSVVSRAVSFASSFTSTITNAARSAVNGFTSTIRGLYTAIVSELSSIWNYVQSWAQPIFDLFAQIGQGITNAFSLLGLGQHSPGDVYKAMKLELDAVTKVSDEAGNTLPKKYQTLGSEIVKGFGSPALDLTFDETANSAIVKTAANGSVDNSGQTINFYFEDVVVDNEERMQKIVDYVEKSMAFDNATAGRTV